MASTSRERPSVLSEGASAAVFDQALRDVEASRGLGAVADLAAWPGYRRRLRGRIHDWTVSERHGADGDDSVEADAEAVTTVERAVFERYRRLLGELDAEDEAGLSVWASKRLRDRDARASAADGDRLVFLDFEGCDRPRWRVLTDALERPRSIDVTLAFVDDPEAAEVYLAAASTRGRLLELGLVETPLPSDPDRPAGLQAVDVSLFRGFPLRDGRIEDSEGLAIWGGPEGEDLGRLVARELRTITARGVGPDAILVAFPRWSEQAEVVCEIVRKAGLPLDDPSPRALDVEPSIAALLQAVRIPIEDWETELVVRILRNGQVQPDWEGVDRLALADVASVLRETTVFRGAQQILSALEAAMGRTDPREDEAAENRRLARLSQAHAVSRLLIGVLDPLNQARPWPEHVRAVREAGAALGLGPRDRRPLEALWDAIEDRADVLNRLGRGAESVSWRGFVDELASIAAGTSAPRFGRRPGTILAGTVEDLAGCRAAHVLLVGLEEGSFPGRPAVERFLDLRPGEEPSAPARSAYAREMLRFLQTLGAADRGVSLFYPTTDVKGQPLLRAGFLDDLLGALTTKAEAACHHSHARFHPALLDQEDLAVTPGDVRVLASAIAAETGRTARLRSLAGDPAHRPALDGAAAALTALERRRRGVPFSEFEGRIDDPAAVAAIAQTFSPEAHTFSPSQLETYLNCPFQFFSRHVLHLKPIEERDELAEDFTERGSRLHDILEEFEKRKAETVDGRTDEDLLAAAVDKVLARELTELSELDLGLRELEYGQIQRTIDQYTRQRAVYEGGSSSSPIPQWFEFGFGDPDTEHPDFSLSLGAEVVKLRGRIDRIDRVETEAGPRFRVIDYKSGTPPSSKDVTEGRMVQLPLYAMAVEKLLFESGDVGLLDVGYWGLKGKGYKPIVFKEWDDVRRGLVERVFQVIHRLRSGEFVVEPRKDDCETYCEYRSVCRIRQVRAAGKTSAVGATVSTEQTVAGRSPRTTRASAQASEET